MSKIRSKNTKPEKVLMGLLRKEGYKFKKYYDLPGKPDIVFTRAKIVIFIDGEFWHGKDFSEWGERTTEFWKNKIAENIKRDKRNDRKLRKSGWHVLHFWGRKVVKDPLRVMKLIERIASVE